MAFNKVTTYGESENIIESEIGLVTKTGLAKQTMASTVDGRKVIKAGTLFDDTEDEYAAVTPASGDNPKAEGWYERSGTSPNYTYTASTDTTVSASKTYYERTYAAGQLYGVVLNDYDMTDYSEYPIAVVVAGRLKSAKLPSATVAAKSNLAAQGLYLV